MRSWFDGAFAVVFDLATPEDGLAFIVDGLEFEPDVKCVDGAAREEVADFAGADYYVDEYVVAAADGGVHAAERGGDWARFAGGSTRSGDIGFFSDGESGGEFLFRVVEGFFGGFVFRDRRNGEDVHAELLILQKIAAGFELRGIFVGDGHGGVGAGETVRVHVAVEIAFVL